MRDPGNYNSSAIKENRMDGVTQSERTALPADLLFWRAQGWVVARRGGLKLGPKCDKADVSRGVSGRFSKCSDAASERRLEMGMSSWL